MSVATHGDSVLATRLARLVTHANAVRGSGLIDKDAATQVVNLAKSTKAFCDALDWDLARKCLDLLVEVSKEIEQADITAVSSALDKHIKAVRDRVGHNDPVVSTSTRGAA